MKGRSNVMCYFEPDEYVRSHCESYRSGTISDRDIETIKCDPDLTYDQREAAISQLNYLSGMYY